MLCLYNTRTLLNTNIAWTAATLIAEIALALATHSFRQWRKRQEQDFFQYFGPAFNSVIWLVATAQVILIVLLTAASHKSEQTVAYYALAAAASVMILHYLITSRIRTWRAIVAVYLVVTLILVCTFPGATVLCAGALRFLGIGGNMPVTILVKTMKPGDTVSAATQIPGCLILAVGEELLIRPTRRKEDCIVKPNTSLLPLQQPYDNVERYAQTDVLKISEFPEDTCGSVDGLAGCSEPSR